MLEIEFDGNNAQVISGDGTVIEAITLNGQEVAVPN
jgi:hypothetical protein